MRRIILALAGTAIITSTSAQAAEDAGLRLHAYRSAGTQSGMGAQLGLSLQLDSKRIVRDSERVQIGFAAGPVMVVQDGRTGVLLRGQGQLAGFTLKPGYSASATVAGQPVATRYTVRGAAEQAQQDAEKSETGGETGNVLLVVGGVVAVVVLGVVVFTKSAKKFASVLDVSR